MLKPGTSETPFPGLSGWIWGKDRTHRTPPRSGSLLILPFTSGNSTVHYMRKATLPRTVFRGRAGVLEEHSQTLSAVLRCPCKGNITCMCEQWVRGGSELNRSSQNDAETPVRIDHFARFNQRFNNWMNRNGSVGNASACLPSTHRSPL